MLEHKFFSSIFVMEFFTIQGCSNKSFKLGLLSCSLIKIFFKKSLISSEKNSGFWYFPYNLENHRLFLEYKSIEITDRMLLKVSTLLGFSNGGFPKEKLMFKFNVFIKKKPEQSS